jgi:hypothetical protein
MALFKNNVVAVANWDPNIFNLEAFNDRHGTDENTFGVTEDIIALSCVAKRLGIPISITGETERLAKSITAEDRQQAQTIRTFFNGKLTVAQLRGENITEFRKDLIKLLNTPMDENGKYVYSEKFTGMIYKLPYFYEYDRSLIDDVFGSEYHEILKPIRADKDNRSTVSLTFLRKMDAKKKRLPHTEYWFADQYDNRVVVHVDKANPLDTLFERYAESKTVRLQGYFVQSRKDTLNFYKVKYWNPVF